MRVLPMVLRNPLIHLSRVRHAGHMIEQAWCSLELNRSDPCLCEFPRQTCFYGVCMDTRPPAPHGHKMMAQLCVCIHSTEYSRALANLAPANHFEWTGGEGGFKQSSPHPTRPATRLCDAYAVPCSRRTIETMSLSDIAAQACNDQKKGEKRREKTTGQCITLVKRLKFNTRSKQTVAQYRYISRILPH